MLDNSDIDPMLLNVEAFYLLKFKTTYTMFFERAITDTLYYKRRKFEARG